MVKTLTKDTEQRLRELVKVTGRPKEYYMEMALQEFLDRRETYLKTVARLEEKSQNISWEDIRDALKAPYVGALAGNDSSKV